MSKDKDKEQHLDDARKLLKSLDTLPNNTDLSDEEWEMVRADRRQSLLDFVTWIETGKRDHIKVNKDEREKLLQHFQ